MPCLRQNASRVSAPADGGRAVFRTIAGVRMVAGIVSKCSCLAIRREEAAARELLEQEEVRYQCNQPAPVAQTKAFVLVKRETALSGPGSDTPVGPETATVLGSLELRIEEGQRISSQASANFPLPEGVSLQGGTILLTSPPVAPGNRASYDLVPVEVNCPELYMFSGHTGDKVELCKASGTCEWKLKSASPAIGTFDHPTDLACSFTATTKGKNTIQLVMGGNVVWEKPTEVIEIVTRAGWGAVAPKAHTQTMPDFQHATLHHTSNTNTGAAEMLRIQQLHMSLFPYVMPFGPFKGKNFDDIGYHFIMDKAGVVYEGRQLEAAPGTPGGPYTKGEHVGSNNTVAGIGFCTMGDYEGTEGNEPWPATRQKDLEKAVSALCRHYKIPASKLSYHNALALPPGSLCPGSNYIPTIPDIIKHVTENLQ
jgi:hypothetical protein